MRHVPPPRPAFATGFSQAGSYLENNESLTRLIACIYDAASTPALWSDTLAQIAGFVGGRAAVMFTKDSVSRDSTPRHHAGVEPKLVEVYSETPAKLDPFSNLPSFEIEEIVTMRDLVQYDEFRRSQFFRKWMKPEGWVDSANCLLEKSASRCSFLTILHGEEQVGADAEMRQRMALLVPHVRRAVQMGKQIDLEQVRAATFTNVLDGLSAGLFLVAADGKLMHANGAGEAMLVAEDCLRATCGRLVICNPDVHNLLQRALPGPAGAAPVHNPVLPVIARNGDRYLIHVLPLSSGGLAKPVIGRAAAAVFVRKAALEGLVPQAIATAFDLTPAELRVLLAIFEFGGIPQAATMLGVADSTVKTHVGRLFEKTGTSRQADLVKLAAGYSTPLLN